MIITGYYDGVNVRISEPLKMNQRVIIIPVDDENDINLSAAGCLEQYANPELIEQEKDVWRRMAVMKHE